MRTRRSSVLTRLGRLTLVGALLSGGLFSAAPAMAGAAPCEFEANPPDAQFRGSVILITAHFPAHPNTNVAFALFSSDPDQPGLPVFAQLLTPNAMTNDAGLVQVERTIAAVGPPGDYHLGVYIPTGGLLVSHPAGCYSDYEVMPFVVVTIVPPPTTTSTFAIANPTTTTLGLANPTTSTSGAEESTTTAAVTTTADGTTTTSEALAAGDTEGSGSMWLIIALILLLLVAVGAYLFGRRRRNGSDVPPPATY